MRHKSWALTYRGVNYPELILALISLDQRPNLDQAGSRSRKHFGNYKWCPL